MRITEHWINIRKVQVWSLVRFMRHKETEFDYLGSFKVPNLLPIECTTRLATVQFIQYITMLFPRHKSDYIIGLNDVALDKYPDAICT